MIKFSETLWHKRITESGLEDLIINQEEKRTCYQMDFAVPVEHQMNKSEKTENILILTEF